MKQYTGVQYFANNLNIDYNNILCAFSFYSGSVPNKTVYRDSWATGSASGTLNSVGNFFNYSGTGYFNGTTYMSLNKDLSLNNSTILLSYEKLRTGNEILFSTLTGNSFDTYSGYCLGINDANKLYFTYWNPIEGPFTFTYSKILSDKNLVLLNRTNSAISIGRYDNNLFTFDTETFEIYQNSIANNGIFTLGGSLNNIPWESSAVNNFSGYIDKFFFINDLSSFYIDAIASGLFSSFSGYKLIENTYCYDTGYFELSGFSYTGVTGVLFSGYNNGIATGVTGYQLVTSGYSYSGITGYTKTSLGFYVNNCGISSEIFQNVGVSGLITGAISVMSGLVGTYNLTGIKDIQLTGVITGSTLVSKTGIICITGYQTSGYPVFDIDQNYLSSLFYKEISLMTNINTQNDVLEVYTEPYQIKTFAYNKDLNYSNVNNNFVLDQEYGENEILLFANGQLLLNSGYNVIQSGYNTFILPKLDYSQSGNKIETNKYFDSQDYLFYDNFTGNQCLFKLNDFTDTGVAIFNTGDKNIFLYRNGQKLISGINYDIIGNNFILIQSSGYSGDYFIIKTHPTFNLISGNGGTLTGLSQFNNKCSQVYYNGIKQKINKNYIENSKFDLISGVFNEKTISYNIYNNTNDYFATNIYTGNYP